MKTARMIVALTCVVLSAAPALAVVSAPTQVAGLKLWLDGNDVDGDGASEGAGETYATTWADKSGLANHFTQGTAGNLPARTLGGQGGKDILTFDGANDHFVGNNGAVLTAGDDNYTYFAVFRSNNAGGARSVYEQNGPVGTGSARSALLQVGGAYGFNGESNDRHDLVPINANTWHLTGMTVDNGLAVNNIKITDSGNFFQGTTGNPATLNVGTTSTNVGRKANNAEFMSGNIAEILVYDRVLTAVEQADVNAYLSGKWAVGGINSLRHRWSFNDGTPNDSIGAAHGTLNGGAQVISGRLSLDGINDFMQSSALPETYINKTLVAWVSLADLAQTAGSAISLETIGGGVFDGIVYAERTANQWMNGSDFFNRSPLNNGGAPEFVTEPGEVMMAISYGPGGSINIYRNGLLYTNYTTGGPVTFNAGGIDVLLGLRHLGAGGDPFLAGFINEARLYDANLSAAEIQTLFTLGANNTGIGAIPEPATFGLLAAAVAGLAVRRRRAA